MRPDRSPTPMQALARLARNDLLRAFAILAAGLTGLYAFFPGARDPLAATARAVGDDLRSTFAPRCGTSSGGAAIPVVRMSYVESVLNPRPSALKPEECGRIAGVDEEEAKAEDQDSLWVVATYHCFGPCTYLQLAPTVFAERSCFFPPTGLILTLSE